MNIVQGRSVGERIVLTLDGDAEGRPVIAAVEMSISALRVRMVSDVPEPIGRVLQQDLAETVASCVDRSGGGGSPSPVESPEFSMELAGLSLRGMRVARTGGNDGANRLMLSFDAAIGNTLAIFGHSPGAASALASFRPRILTQPEGQVSSQTLFEEMLSHLYLPLVNLNNYLRQVADGSTREVPGSLGNSVVQLKTRAEMLQSAFDGMISEMMVGKFTAPVGRVDAERA